MTAPADMRRVRKDVWVLPGTDYHVLAFEDMVNGQYAGTYRFGVYQQLPGRGLIPVALGQWTFRQALQVLDAVREGRDPWSVPHVPPATSVAPAHEVSAGGSSVGRERLREAREALR